MSMIRCRKCGAGRGSLEPIIEHLENGAILQTVRCILCGERRSRVASRYEELSEARRRIAYGKTCGVVGCNVKLSHSNTTGMCKTHGKVLHNWMHSKRLKPAPYVQTTDGWIPNPEREVAHAHV